MNTQHQIEIHITGPQDSGKAKLQGAIVASLLEHSQSHVTVRGSKVALSKFSTAEAWERLRGIKTPVAITCGAPMTQLADERAELIAALRNILNAPGEGYVTPSEPDSFESQCRSAEQLLNRLKP